MSFDDALETLIKNLGKESHISKDKDREREIAVSRDSVDMPQGIQTPRLLLRPMAKADGPLVVEWRNEPSNRDLMGSRKTIDIEGHLEWFNSRPQTRRDVVIIEKSSFAAIGTLSVSGVEGLPDDGELGKLLSTEYRGRGYALEATYAWLIFLLQGRHFERVIARTRKENMSNIRLNKRLGFRVSEYMRDPISGENEFVIMHLDFSSLRSSEYAETIDWTVEFLSISEMRKGGFSNV